MKRSLALLFATFVVGCFPVSRGDQWLELNNEANSLYQQGKHWEGLGKSKEALAFAEKYFGPNNERVGASLNQIGLSHMAQGNYSVAEPLFERALSIQESDLGPQNPKLAVTINNLAVCFANQGKLKKAPDLYNRAITIFDTAGIADQNLAVALLNLADVYQKLGDFTQADPLYRRGVRVSEANLGKNKATVMLLGNVAAVFRDHGKEEAASEFEKKAAAIRASLPEAASFQVEPTGRSSILYSVPLIAGDVLDVKLKNMPPTDTFLIQKCGIPCNTAKTVSALKGKESSRHLNVDIRESGDYYVWVQRSLESGEVGAAIVTDFSAKASTFRATYGTGTEVEASLTLK